MPERKTPAWRQRKKPLTFQSTAFRVFVILFSLRQQAAARRWGIASSEAQGERPLVGASATETAGLVDQVRLSASQSARTGSYPVQKCAISEISDMAHYPRNTLILEVLPKVLKTADFSQNISDNVIVQKACYASMLDAIKGIFRQLLR